MVPQIANAAADDWILLLGRVLLSLVFLVSGIHKALWYAKAAEEFRQARAPLVGLTLPATISLHLAGSICLILGVYTGPASIALAVFTLLATERTHGFWRLAGADRLHHSRDALANLGLVGGLLLLTAFGPGRLALGVAY